MSWNYCAYAPNGEFYAYVDGEFRGTESARKSIEGAHE